ncbi:MAG: hypothetical protein ACPK7O_07435 [Methanobacterium sp.]
MAKKRQKPKKTTKTGKETEVTSFIGDKEYNNLRYMFLGLLIGGILFLGIYLVGLINILLT